MRNTLRLLPLILMVPAFLMLFPADLSAETPAKDASTQADSAPKPWEFDQSLYTNNPKTGQRTWQYKKGKAAYHDPNSWFDSPHMGYPFDGNWTLEPYDVFPYPYYPGPNAEHPSFAPDPMTPEQANEGDAND